MKQQFDICPQLQMETPIYIDEIAWLEGIDNYTMIHFVNGKKVLIAKTLRTLDTLLASHCFLRINRQTLICTEHISEWTRNRQSFVITSAQGQSWVVSRRKTSKVKNSLIDVFSQQLWQNKYCVAD